MVLVLTNSADETADYLSEKLTESRVKWIRLDSDRLSAVEVNHNSRTTLSFSGGPSLSPSDVSNVWLRRPERPRLTLAQDPAINHHAEDEWAAAIEGFLCQISVERWMNHPSALAASSQKVEQLVRATTIGLVSPASLVTQSPEQAAEFCGRFGSRVIAKPVSHGRLSREDQADSIIYTSEVNVDDFARLDSVRFCPTLFQERIAKVTDVRVTVIDDEVLSVRMDHTDIQGSQVLDVRRANMAGVRYEAIDAPAHVRSQLLSLVKSYGLRFAAIDFGVDSEGNWIFFELNPTGQWAWLDLLGGQTLYKAFIRSFCNA